MEILEITRRAICPDIELFRIGVPDARQPNGFRGAPVCSLKRYCRHHSPDGIEWGYAGSGPADLALSICHHLFPLGCDSLPSVRLWRGRCSQIAWTLHQGLKEAFIVRIPQGGGKIRGAEVDAWIDDQLDVLRQQIAIGRYPELVPEDFGQSGV